VYDFTMLHEKSVRVGVATTGIGFGIFLSFLGFTIIGVCSEPGGCRAVPFWPLVAPGLGLVMVGALVIISTLRADTEQK
jgi:hypothetical protein